jgi:hypothetical protein
MNSIRLGQFRKLAQSYLQLALRPAGHRKRAESQTTFAARSPMLRLSVSATYDTIGGNLATKNADRRKYDSSPQIANCIPGCLACCLGWHTTIPGVHSRAAIPVGNSWPPGCLFCLVGACPLALPPLSAVHAPISGCANLHPRCFDNCHNH